MYDSLCWDCWGGVGVSTYMLLALSAAATIRLCPVLVAYAAAPMALSVHGDADKDWQCCFHESGLCCRRTPSVSALLRIHSLAESMSRAC